MYLKELKAAKKAAREAGKELLKYFYSPKLKVNYKSENNPVTEADIISQKIIINKLKKFNYGIIAEEGDAQKKNKNINWIIDPLDGTKEFINKIDEFAIMIGLSNRGNPVLGVIYAPAKDVMYFAVKNQGAFMKRGERKSEKIKVSIKKNFQKIVLFISRFHQTGNELDLAKKLGIKKIVKYGSCLKACGVAESKGEISFTTSPNTKEWDTCASDIILKEAGGKFTDIKGRDLKYNKKDVHNKYGYLATNGVIHSKVIEALKEIKK